MWLTLLLLGISAIAPTASAADADICNDHWDCGTPTQFQRTSEPLYPFEQYPILNATAQLNVSRLAQLLAKDASGVNERPERDDHRPLLVAFLGGGDEHAYTQRMVSAVAVLLFY